MTNTTTGWVVFIAAIGMMFSLLAVDIAALPSWDVATKPVFVGTFLGHIAAVIAAFVGGKLIPQPPDDNTNKVSQKKLVELSK